MIGLMQQGEPMSKVNTKDLVFLLLALVRKKYANRIIEKYKNLIWKIIHKKLPGYTGGKADIPQVAKQDVFSKIAVAFLEIVNNGKFRGEHGEASAVACIQNITRKKCADCIRWLTKERKARNFQETESRDKLWFEKISSKDPHIEKNSRERHEAKTQDEIFSEIAKHLDVIQLRKEGYTISKIADMLSLTEGQVRGRISRGKERLSKETKSLGWATPKTGFVDESLKLISSLSPYFDKTVDELEPDDFQDRFGRGGITLGYTVPTGKDRIIRRYGGFYKGHIELINKMRKIQHEGYKQERICVKCHRPTEIEDVIIDNTLAYCKKCYKNIKKHEEMKYGKMDSLQLGVAPAEGVSPTEKEEAVEFMATDAPTGA